VRIVEAQGALYCVKKTYPTDTEIGYEELKRQWKADIILRQNDILYLCESIIEAEWEDK